MSINSTSTQNYQNLVGEGITYAQIVIPDPSLLANQTVIYQTSDGALWQSNGTAIVAFTGGGGGGGVWGSITGELSNQTDLQAALNAKTDDLTAATLDAGPTDITRASHLNRPLTVDQAGATTGVFAAAATSGALAGDGFELLNVGAGTFTANGDISAATGYTLTAATGATFTALYDSATDAFYSTTPAASSGGDYAAIAESGWGYTTVTQANSTTYSNLGTGGPNNLDSSTNAASGFSDGVAGYSFRPRVRVTAAAAAAQRTAGLNGSSNYMRIEDGSTMNGRFPFTMVGAIADTITSGRFCMGIVGSSAFNTSINGTSAEVSVIPLDLMVLGCDSGDANLSIIFGDNSATKTKIALGSNFPASQFIAYSFNVQKNAAGTSFTTVTKNLGSGAVHTQTITSSDGTLPRTGITYQLIFARGSAANAVTALADFVSFFMGRTF